MKGTRTISRFCFHGIQYTCTRQEDKYLYRPPVFECIYLQSHFIIRLGLYLSHVKMTIQQEQQASKSQCSSAALVQHRKASNSLVVVLQLFVYCNNAVSFYTRILLTRSCKAQRRLHRTYCFTELGLSQILIFSFFFKKIFYLK